MKTPRAAARGVFVSVDRFVSVDQRAQVQPLALTQRPFQPTQALAFGLIGA
jgi:hypothetical protein